MVAHPWQRLPVWSCSPDTGEWSLLIRFICRSRERFFVVTGASIFNKRIKLLNSDVLWMFEGSSGDVHAWPSANVPEITTSGNPIERWVWTRVRVVFLFLLLLLLLLLLVFLLLVSMFLFMPLFGLYFGSFVSAFMAASTLPAVVHKE
jgi:hypothetical protein